MTNLCVCWSQGRNNNAPSHTCRASRLEEALLDAIAWNTKHTNCLLTGPDHVEHHAPIGKWLAVLYTEQELRGELARRDTASPGATSGYSRSVPAPDCQRCGKEQSARLPREGDPLGQMCADCVPAEDIT